MKSPYPLSMASSLPWLLLLCYTTGVLSDGELLVSTTEPSTTEPSANVSSSEVCNPYLAYRYLKIANACCVRSDGCTDSWDLYEFAVYDTAGERIITSSAASSGYGKSNAAGKALDFSTDTWWEGDYDIGMSCSCWGEDKVGGQWMIVDLGEPKIVKHIMIIQGGADDVFAVSQVQIECSQDMVNWDRSPLRFSVSYGQTQLQCSQQGCLVTNCEFRSLEECTWQDTCSPAVAGSKSWKLGVFAFAALVTVSSTL
eukprot:s89_g5.t1